MNYFKVLCQNFIQMVLFSICCLGVQNFPNSIGNLKRLSEMDLSGCNFNGSVPNSMANLTLLIYLDMSSNYFTAPIPSFSMAKNLTIIESDHYFQSLERASKSCVLLFAWQFTWWEYSSISFFPSIIANIVSWQQPIFWSTPWIFKCFFFPTGRTWFESQLATSWKGQFPCLSLNSKVFRT